nr:12253_t:CDS:10 [Entrophospora candida]
MKIANKEISEAQLLRDIVFVLQGIEGQHIKFEKGSSSYIIDPKMTITYSTRDLLHRLIELGWLYRRVNEYVKINFNDPSIGLVGQAFSSALQRELTELMSVLVECCKQQRGGALVSTIYKYTYNGDPFIQNFINNILEEVSKPFFEMLQRWIYEGELEDPFEEFFVACDPNVEEDLWQSKYKIRKDMQPTFISSLLAKKIFSIGKSLNFIRYSCNDNDWIINNAKPTGADESTVNIIGLESSIDNAYKTTSKQLMNLLFAKYKLKEHLIAIKRYLLLGQGDFIQHLMPANTLYRHNLTGTLEAAIRASNAQYDDPDILRRLDVRLLEISYGDVGWDVFSLDYYVDSPINTILTPSAMNQYLKLFNFLWRLKHVEHDLSFAWRRNMTSARTLHQIKELKKDINNSRLVCSEMTHFIYQLQYYILFEVVECSWDELVTNINKKCVDLDSLIEAHNKYLTNLTSKCFLNTSNNQDELYNFTIKELMHRENINIVSEIHQGKSRNLGDTDEEKSSFLSDDSKEKLKPIQAQLYPNRGLIHISLFINVKNSTELKKRLLSHDSELSYAFVDAKVLLIAINNAVHYENLGILKTHNVHSEIVYNLSPTTNISESLRRFGISNSSNTILIIKVGEDSDNVKSHLSKLIDGEESSLEELSKFTDFSCIKKPPKYENSSLLINKDFIKLTNFQVGALDKLISKNGNGDRVTMFGIWISGTQIRVYEMNLKFDGIYMLTLMSNVILPTEPSQFPSMVSVLEAIYNVKDHVVELIETISNNIPTKYLLTYTRSPCGLPKEIKIPVRV